MKFMLKQNEGSTDWHDYTFIMPTVSIGNVGQLAVDLLISTLKTHLVGYLLSDCIIPVIGRDAFDSKSNSLTTSLDVYKSDEKKLVILQQRSPLLKKRQSSYVEELVDWIAENQFKNVLILTSTLACERIDSQLFGPQCRFVTSDNIENLDIDRLSKVLPKLESRNDLGNGDSKNLATEPHIPGSGIAKKLLQKCNSKGIKTLMFLRFSYEADNIPDAMELVHVANSYFGWIDLEKEKFNAPSSWSLLFGSHYDQIIYQ